MKGRPENGRKENMPPGFPETLLLPFLSRKCCRCHESKPHLDFNKNKAGKEGLSNTCRACQSISSAKSRVKRRNKVKVIPETKTCSACHQTKSQTEFCHITNANDGLEYLCRQCKNAHGRKNPRPRPKLSTEQKQRKGRRTKVAYKTNRPKQREKVYGITPEQYTKMLTDQNSVCFICSGPPGKKALCVDHCHKSGSIRSLLCRRCNSGLGFFRDSPDLLREATKYLEFHKMKEAA